MTIIGDKKLTKAAENLYTEPYKDGRDFKWYRHPESLHMDVYDINLLSITSVDDPRSSLSGEEYKEERGECLQGVGVFENRSVHLIDSEGTIGPSIDRVEFSIRSFQRERDKEMPHGSMWWQDAESLRWEGRRDEYLFMEIYVSPVLFAGMVADIEKQPYTSIQLGVYVECFQSEVERSLAEPYMRQDYCIEEEGTTATYFNSLSVKSRLPSPYGKSLPKDDLDDQDEFRDDSWTEPQDQIAELKNLVGAYMEIAAHHAQQAKSMKIALWGILILLGLALFVLVD